MCLRVLLFSLCVCTSCCELFAQPKRQFLDDIDRRYATSDAVMLESRESIIIENDKDKGLQIRSEHFHQVYFRGDNARLQADEFIPFSTFNTVGNLQACYFEPRGKGFKKIPVETFKTIDNYSQSVFYDDSKAIRVVFPSVARGGVSQLQYSETYSDPHILGNFYFSSYMPVVESVVSLEFPVSVRVNYKIFNDRGDIHVSHETSKGVTRYTFRSRNVSAIENGQEDFNISHYMPHLAIYIDSYLRGTDTVEVFSGVQQLYRWLYSYSSDIDRGTPPGMRELVDSLVAGKTQELKRAKSIYYWVQDNIKYIAMVSGYMGITPRDAGSVFGSRYGDCKDMSSLLVKMFGLAGIEAHLCWVGTRDLPYTVADLPTATVHNHMVAVVVIDGRYYFADATAYFISLAFPSDAIQGKEAMVSIDSDTFRLVQVPVVEKNRSRSVDSTYLVIDGNDLKGRGTEISTGYLMFERAIPVVRTPANKRHELMAKVLRKGSNKFQLTGYRLSSIHRDSALTAWYSFAIPGIVKEIGETYYLNINLERPFVNEQIDTSRQKFDKKFEKRFGLKYVTVLSIPPGYYPKSVPESADFRADDIEFGFSSSYMIDNAARTLTVNLSIDINTLSIPPSQFHRWNEMVRQLNEMYSRVIILEKEGGTNRQVR